MESIAQLIEGGVPVDTENEAETALYIAAKRGHSEIVRLLLANGAEAARTSMGPFDSKGTPLYAAITWGHIDVVRVFLDAGVEPNLVDSPGDEATQGCVGLCRAQQFHLLSEGLRPRDDNGSPRIEAPERRRAALIAYLRTLSEDPAPLS